MHSGEKERLAIYIGGYIPSYMKQFLLSLGDPHREWLERKAERTGMSMSHVIRMAIQDRIDSDAATARANAAIRRKRMAKAKALGRHSGIEWDDLLFLSGYRCLRCNVSGEKLTKDHIIPLQCGGSDSIDNLQPLCLSCNVAKPGSKDYRSADLKNAISLWRPPKIARKGGKARQAKARKT